MKSADAHQQCASFCRISLHKILFDVSAPFQNTNFKKIVEILCFGTSEVASGSVSSRDCEVHLHMDVDRQLWKRSVGSPMYVYSKSVNYFLSREIYFCQLPCRNIAEEPVRITRPYRRSNERFKLSILFFNEWVFHGCSRSRARKLASCGWSWVLVIEPMQCNLWKSSISKLL